MAVVLKANTPINRKVHQYKVGSIMANPGTPAHEPTVETRAQVAALVAFGIPQIHIARQVGISDETLRKYYQNELDCGLHDANSQVANVLFEKAVIQKDLSAVIFWLKTRARWSDKAPEADSKVMSVIEQILALKNNV